MSGGAFDDRRAAVFGDGAEFVVKASAKFDVIIVDSTDPIGPGEQLFTEAFYIRCRRLLLPGGMITMQSGAPFYEPQQREGVCDRLTSSFGAGRPFLAPVPTDAGGMLALVAVGESHRALRPPAEILREQFQRLRPGTRYYTPDVHRNFGRKRGEQQRSLPRCPTLGCRCHPRNPASPRATQLIHALF